METINYQGQQIEVEEVQQFSGYLTTALYANNWAMNHQGDEKLSRAPDGQYYLHRQLQIWDLDGERERHASGRIHVHRVSLKYAILWAITRCGSQTDDLRREAAAVLAGPAVLNPTSRFSDGSMVISLHLKPAVASLVRAVAEAEDDTPLGVVWDATADYVVGALTQGGHVRERDLNGLFNDNAPEEIVPPHAMLRLVDRAGAIHAGAEIGRELLGKLKGQAEHNKDDWQFTLTSLLEGGLRMGSEWVGIVELDDLAETLLRRYHRQKYGEARYEKVMPSDVVNGVMVNWLEAMLKVHQGRTDGDAIEEARDRRRHGLSDVDEEVIDQVERADEEGPLPVKLFNPDGSLWSEFELDAPTAAAVAKVAKKEGQSIEDTISRALEACAGVLGTQEAQQIERETQISSGISFHLEPKAAKLPARYRRLRPQEDQRDVLNAAAINWLEAAVEGASQDKPGSWDADVAAARRRRIRRGEVVRDSLAVTNAVQMFEDGDFNVTVHFKPEVAQL